MRRTTIVTRDLKTGKTRNYDIDRQGNIMQTNPPPVVQGEASRVRMENIRNEQLKMMAEARERMRQSSERMKRQMEEQRTRMPQMRRGREI
jgi:hypothetical protein